MPTKSFNFIFLLPIFGLSACQGHLPAIETEPETPGPKITDIVQNVKCELYQIVNSGNSPSNVRRRIKSYDYDNYVGAQTLAPWASPAITKGGGSPRPGLSDLLPVLVDDNFVASVQLTLDVTDSEGLNPSLSFVTPYPLSSNFTFGLGGQLNGTQDRVMTLNFNVNLADLSGAAATDYCLEPHDGAATRDLKGLGLTGGIAGNLGLIDVVADGLLGIDTSSPSNTPPQPQPKNLTSIDLKGDLKVPKAGSLVDYTLSMEQADLVFTPSQIGTFAPPSVQLNGLANIINDKKKKASYSVSWTGSMIPSDHGDHYLFSLSGTMNYVPDRDSLDPINDAESFGLGYSPTVSLIGRISSNYDISDHSEPLLISGIGSNSSSQVTQAPPPQFDLILGPTSSEPNEIAGVSPSAPPSLAPSAQSLIPSNAETASLSVPAAKPASGGGSGASSSSSGTTSFGSTVDFSLVYGLNGGPGWTLTHFKGPAGGGTSGQLVSIGRTYNDSLSITFVPACLNKEKNLPTNVAGYWLSVPECDDEFGGKSAQIAAAQAAGFQNNSYMSLRNIFSP